MRFFLFLAAVLILCGTAQSEEIKLNKQPTHVDAPSNLFKSVYINKLEDLPYDFAKNLEPEMYYWWAKAYNAKQWAKYPNIADPGTLRIINRGTMYTRGNLGRSNRGTSNYGNLNTVGNSATRIMDHTNKTFIRHFKTNSGGGPATFYNPYYR